MTMPINKELLLQVRDRILAEPANFDMRCYAAPREDGCGTTACIAGWAIALHGGLDLGTLLERVDSNSLPELTAACALGITFGASESQATSLFHERCWPWKFRVNYLRARECGDDNQRARAAADRINHFIQTEGAE